MSHFEFLQESYQLHDDKLFSIPEDVKYPILDEENALCIFRHHWELEQPIVEEDYFLGESVHELRLSETDHQEFEFAENKQNLWESISPKIEETHYEDHALKNFFKISSENRIPSFSKVTQADQKTPEIHEGNITPKTEAVKHENIKEEPATVSQPVWKRSRFGREIKPQTNIFPSKLPKRVRKITGKQRTKNPNNLTSDEDSSSHKGIILAKRKDVINKTLLRSIKRYYTSMFDEFARENQYTKQERKEFWREYIDEFTKSIYGDSLNAQALDDQVIQEGINAFMASMVTPNSIKRTSDDNVYSLMLEEFSSLLYKYSIKKLAAFISNPSVSYVLRQFNQKPHIELKYDRSNYHQSPNEDWVKSQFEHFLESDVTLSKNRNLYIKAWKEIIRMAN